MDILGNLGRSSLSPHNGSKTEADRKQIIFLDRSSFEGVPERNEGLQRIFPKMFGKSGAAELFTCIREAKRKRDGSKTEASETRHSERNVFSFRLSCGRSH